MGECPLHDKIQYVFDNALNSEIYRRHDVESRNGRSVISAFAFKLLPHKVARRKDSPVNSSQIFVVIRLQTALPRVVRRNKTQHLRKKIAVNILARGICGKINTFEIVASYKICFVYGYFALDSVFRNFRSYLFINLLIGELERLRKQLCHQRMIADAVWSDINGVAGSAGRKNNPVGVRYVPSVRRYRQIARPLLQGSGLKLFSPNYLYIAQTQKNDKKNKGYRNKHCKQPFFC